MQQAVFTPKTDVQDYLNNTLNYEIYNALTESEPWEDLFEPLTYFNLLYERFNWILNNLHKPLTISEGLSELNLNDKQYYFLLDCLLKLIFQEADPSFANLYTTSQDFPGSYSLFSSYARFAFNETSKRFISGPYQQKEKSLYLIFTIIDKEQTRIKREATVQLPISISTISYFEEEEEEVLSELKLSDRKGVKADVIRIFSAMFDLHLIETTDGSELTKEKFMTMLGEFLGEDFSNYAQSLSLALNASQEAHLKIFGQLEVKAKSQWEAILQKKKK